MSDWALASRYNSTIFQLFHLLLGDDLQKRMLNRLTGVADEFCYFLLTGHDSEVLDLRLLYFWTQSIISSNSFCAKQ